MKNSNRITEDMADLLLKISAMLMTSGANTNRILMIINKFAALLHTQAEVFINHKAFIISITDLKTGNKTTQVKRLPPNVVNFSTISALSKAGMTAEKEQWDFEKIKEKVDGIEKKAHHPQLLTLISVSFAGGGLAILFGGEYFSFMAVFAGTFLGLFVKQTLSKREFNPVLATFFGTLVASAIAASILKLIPGINPNIAIATSVLFSIPGVPLINSFTDFMDGYFLTGFVRFMNGLLQVIFIAAALFIVMYLFHIQNL